MTNATTLACVVCRSPAEIAELLRDDQFAIKRAARVLAYLANT